MATLPGYVGILYESYGEEFDASVVETEMERGPSKLRVGNSQVVMKLPATLDFASLADAEAFQDWYFTVIKRIGWFDMAHPRTGVAIRARLEHGKLGRLQLVPGSTPGAQRDVVFEYMR
ncbi:hypothetical protein NG829_08505 [Xanthomonas sacchari]|uniref:hypothetical protein n=1 Tax=Xanthomonas sacchari TaxID=56458 RepID=UPI00225E5C42|nr:hypothetical protein [Xanthomonas sacchari]UYK82317.1 hypothetical protein NG829_08505 [Xanthomonas sacchari]